jgi:hypothetical protein
MKRIAPYLSLLIVILCSSSCVTAPHFAGTIQNNSYTPSANNYTVPIPVSAGLGGRIQDSTNTVIFVDDFGSLFRIETWALSNEDMQITHTLDRQKYLGTMLKAFYLPNTILRVIPSATVVYQEWHPEFHGGALYVEVKMPGGAINSVSINGAPPVKEDTERGLLLFVEGNNICIVSTALGCIKRSDESASERENRTRPLLHQTTVDFAKTIAFKVN